MDNKISIEEVFESEYLEIEYLDKTLIEGFEPDSGYFVLLVKDLDEIDTNHLINLGFEKLKEDLFVIKKEAIELPITHLDKIRNERAQKISNISFDKLQKDRVIELVPLYDKIRKLTNNINYDFLFRRKIELFQPSSEALNSILGLNGLVCCDSYTFCKFCILIYQLLRESFFQQSLCKFGEYYCEMAGKSFNNKKDLQKCIKHDFLGKDDFFYRISNFRHICIHIVKRMTVDNGKNETEAIDSLQDYIDEKISREIQCSFDYFLIQKELLKDAIKFLKKIHSFLMGEYCC